MVSEIHRQPVVKLRNKFAKTLQKIWICSIMNDRRNLEKYLEVTSNIKKIKYKMNQSFYNKEFHWHPHVKYMKTMSIISFPIARERQERMKFFKKIFAVSFREVGDFWVAAFFSHTNLSVWLLDWIFFFFL